jgi:ketosteroid isomerase-like protein
MSNETRPSVVIYKRLIAAFNANDLDSVRGCLDEQLSYVIPGRSPIAGRTVGIDAHLQALRLARELSDNTLKLEPSAVLAEGPILLVWGRIMAARKNRVLDCEHCVMYRLQGDRIVEGRTLPTDLYAFDEFWSD